MTTRRHAANPPAPTRTLWVAVVGLGVLVNPLLLTGPLFMVQVYDRVLPAGSVPTLAVLFALVAFLYAMMALLDAARARIMARLAARWRATMEPRVIAARIAAPLRAPPDPAAATLLRDLDAGQTALASSAFLALLDLPWTIAFLVLLSLVHPMLGLLAVGGGLLLVALAAFSHWRQRAPGKRAQAARDAAQKMLDGALSAPEDVAASTFASNLLHRAQTLRGLAHAEGAAVNDRAVFDRALARAFRLFMQSAMMALGALLALRGEVSAGLIIAASVFLGRALAPVEALAQSSAALWAARRGVIRLRQTILAQERAQGALPRPGPVRTGAPGALVLSDIVITPPWGGTPILRLGQVTVAPGQALGVIGPGGAGKTVLARALSGGLAIAAGTARLGDTRLPLPEACVGVLPQRATLLQGSIAENIARMAPDPDEAAVRDAAQAAGLHDTILALPQGYDTPIDPASLWLPGGVVQRLALARALYGNPALILLDEPVAFLDSEGVSIVHSAIRAAKARGACVLVFAHRPAAIAECDLVLALKAGVQAGFGPRDRVLRDVVRGRTALVQARVGTAP